MCTLFIQYALHNVVNRNSMRYTGTLINDLLKVPFILRKYLPEKAARKPSDKPQTKSILLDKCFFLLTQPSYRIHAIGCWCALTSQEQAQ